VVKNCCAILRIMGQVYAHPLRGQSQDTAAGGPDSAFEFCFLAPQVGLEPTTLRLTAECSAIELLRSVLAGTVLTAFDFTANLILFVKSLSISVAGEVVEYRFRGPPPGG
jgi:hypothetical protein